MKRVVIFGATSAMAEQAARLYADSGAALFLVGRNSLKLQAVASDLASRGAFSVQQRVLDLADINAHAALVAEAWDALGGIDIALIAYGALGNQTACETRFTDAADILNLNFTSAASLCTRIANRMIQQKGGTLAVISSVAGDRGRKSNYVYGAAKAGLDAFLSGLRNRLHSQGIHVVTIKPGFVDTPMTAHLDQGPLFVSAATAGRAIHRAIEKKRSIAYVPWFWRYIMLIIRHVPETLFKRMSL